jgi:fructan beta-fructosidase
MQLHQTESVFTESLRPTFHFTPELNWMNDPNGLVFHKGNYHLFFQHNPDGILWGNMSWGHAVSTDLINWEHLPVAIACTETAGIFSGSVVIDHTNSSGFGSLENPPMVAIYTLHQNDQSNQSQHIAYSLDDGLTWVKYANNPVLDLGMKDFRDPKVSWDASTNTWLMTVAKPLEFKISFFTSPDLKSWNHLSDFGPLGATGGCWECPDLFSLPTPTGEKVWVLLVSLNPGGITNGSGTQYFIGNWDGTTFTTEQKSTKWIDYGRDNYAGVTFNDAPEGRRIFIGWMSNWEYAVNFPSPIWRGQMTTPRELAIVEADGEIFLSSNPISELKTEHDYSFEINANEDSIFTISSENKEVVINYDASRKKISINRSAAWLSGMNDTPQISPKIDLENFTLRILLDHGSAEIFVPEVGLSMTSLHTLPASSVVLQKTAKRLQ